jgi:hypothetical protein
MNEVDLIEQAESSFGLTLSTRAWSATAPVFWTKVAMFGSFEAHVGPTLTFAWNG